MGVDGSPPRIFRSIIMRHSIPPNLIFKGSNARLILGNVTYFLAPVSLAEIAVSFTINPVPLAYYLGIAILLGAILGFAFYLQLGIILSYGIVVQPEGFAVLRHNGPTWALSKTYFREFAPWELLTSVRVQGLFSEYVSLGGGPLGRGSDRVLVDRKEARAILSDPRCPLYGRVPERVARKLGLERSGHVFITPVR